MGRNGPMFCFAMKFQLTSFSIHMQLSTKQLIKFNVDVKVSISKKISFVLYNLDLIVRFLKIKENFSVC